jgi:hypothetical protein
MRRDMAQSLRGANRSTPNFQQKHQIRTLPQKRGAFLFVTETVHSPHGDTADSR